MIPFEYLTPHSLAEAVSLLDPEDPGIRPVGGGTAVMLMMKAGVLRPTRLVALRKLEAKYSQISCSPEGELHIGGMTTLAALEHSPLIQAGWPTMAKALRSLSNVRVRNVATLGGNLAHGDPHMDMPPVLSMLGARAIITGPRGTREMAVQALYHGYYETALDRDELITGIVVPPLGKRRTAYMKVTTRATHDWPALGMAVSIEAQEDVIVNARLIVGAATDKPTSLSIAETMLKGAQANHDNLKKAGEAAAAELDIASDQHGSAAYKKHLISVYLGRAVRTALGTTTAGDEHDTH